MELVLTGDIGGTNARFALFSDSHYVGSSLRTLPVAKQPDLADTIADYFSMLGEGAVGVSKVALSVATTAEYADTIELTNNNVSFRLSDLVGRFGLQKARVVNDFTAAALSVVSLPEENLVRLYQGTEVADAPKAVLGAGTGLGVSGLIHAGTHWVPLQGQGGHATLLVQTERELRIREIIAEELGHVSAERLLSGPGTVRVYTAICQLEKTTAQFSCASQISGAAMNGSCRICEEVMALFCKYLGIVAGDLALTLGAEGGIYIAGGIVPHLDDYFLQSDFLQWLQDKGRFSEFVKDMPVYLVTGDEPALFGAFKSLQHFYDKFGHTVYAHAVPC